MIGTRTALALVALGLAAAACAVYDSSLLPSGDALNGTSGQSGGGSSGNDSGGEGGLVTGGSDAGNGSVLGGAGGEDSLPGGGAGNAGRAGGGAASIAGAGSGGHSGTGGNAGAVGTGGNAGAVGTGGVAGAAGSGGMAGKAGTGGGGAGGTAGGGGTAGALLCSDHPLTQKPSWVATASHQSSTPKNPPSCLTDNTAARWSSGKPQSGDEWLQVNFGATVNIRSINLQQGVDTNDYPRSYAVYVSDTNNDLTGTVQASGVGTSGVTTTIQLPKTVSGRYLLIKQLGSSLSWWSVAEIEVSCVDG